jgi:hypothetical protein
MTVEGESIPVEVVRRMLLELTVTATEKKGGESFDVYEHTNRFWVQGDAQAQPLYKAIKDGDAPMVKALIAVGFDMKVHDRETGEPYAALAAAAFHGHVDVVRVLLAAGVIQYRTGPYVMTPLTIAASEGHVDVMRVLLEAGRWRESTSTALRAAVEGGHPAAIQVLLDAGAEVSSDDSVLIEVAVESGHRCCLGPLLRAGAIFDDEVVSELSHFQTHPNSKEASAWRYIKRVQDAGGYDQLVEKYRRVLTAPQSCLSSYLKFQCEIRFRLGAFPTDLTFLVLEFWKPPGGL